ncbi:murein hydrolase activator EnvC family protein [Halomonas llamarensis]|uniref:Peptidoglycan DD-metalloendopeptidase family protein n=1 Tax=Halomonas llamarensis TaxID=2945104 RepID=A0ABT0SVM8_9GAMM|nr:peptidoglycan DD-metalloendopeptidase family protein [Halomonas llamarensis]MCL7931505.1 peptidoglycan DD-metalloendopeptidase family protein [Halomonas llamarensis]
MRRLLAFIGTLLLSGGFSPALSHASEADAKRQLDAIGEQIETVAERLSATDTARDDASRELRDIETQLAETHRRLDALQAERRKLADESAQLRAHRERLERQRHGQSQALAKQLAALYRVGPTPQLKLLLNQGNPAELDRMQTYLNRLTQARQARIEAIAELDTALADTEAELAARQQRLDTLSAELESQSATLAERTAQRRELVATLDSRFQSEEQRLASLEQEREQAQRALEQIRQEMARLDEPAPSTHISRTQGDLPWPVQGSISATYHSQEGVHFNGIVIKASAGTPVSAVHAGRVVFADWMRGFGNLLIIDHGDHVMTLYAHLQRFSARPGQRVTQGDDIGRVGDTGGQAQAALYFEVRQSGEPINPQRWIARR